MGCRSGPPYSRRAVHYKIAVQELTWLGWRIPPDKTTCGDGIVLLGVELDALISTSSAFLYKAEYLQYFKMHITMGTKNFEQRFSAEFRKIIWEKFIRKYFER